jgi:hypothetical protein
MSLDPAFSSLRDLTHQEIASIYYNPPGHKPEACLLLGVDEWAPKHVVDEVGGLTVG